MFNLPLNSSICSVARMKWINDVSSTLSLFFPPSHFIRWMKSVPLFDSIWHVNRAAFNIFNADFFRFYFLWRHSKFGRDNKRLFSVRRFDVYIEEKEANARSMSAWSWCNWNGGSITYWWTISSILVMEGSNRGLSLKAKAHRPQILTGYI